MKTQTTDSQFCAVMQYDWRGYGSTSLFIVTGKVKPSTCMVYKPL